MVGEVERGGDDRGDSLRGNGDGKKRHPEGADCRRSAKLGSTSGDIDLVVGGWNPVTGG